MKDPSSFVGCAGGVPSDRSNSPHDYSATFQTGQSTETLTTSPSLIARGDGSNSADDDSSTFQTEQSVETMTTRSSRVATMMQNAMVFDIGIMRFMCFARESAELKDENHDPTLPTVPEEKSEITEQRDTNEPVMIKNVYVRSPPTTPISRSHGSAFMSNSVTSPKHGTGEDIDTTNVETPLQQDLSRQKILSSGSATGERNEDDGYGGDDMELDLVPTLCSTMTAVQQPGSAGSFFCFREGKSAQQFFSCGGNAEALEAVVVRSSSFPEKTNDSKMCLPCKPIAMGLSCCQGKQTKNLEINLLLPPSETKTGMIPSDTTPLSKAEVGQEVPRLPTVPPQNLVSWSGDGKETIGATDLTSWPHEVEETPEEDTPTSWSFDARDISDEVTSRDIVLDKSQRDPPPPAAEKSSTLASNLLCVKPAAATETLDELVQKAKMEQEEKRRQYYRQRRQIFLESHALSKSRSEFSADESKENEDQVSISSGKEPDEKHLPIMIDDPPSHLEQELTISFEDPPLSTEEPKTINSFDEQPFDCSPKLLNQINSPRNDSKVSENQGSSVYCDMRVVQTVTSQSDMSQVLAPPDLYYQPTNSPEHQTTENQTGSMSDHPRFVEQFTSQSEISSLVPTLPDLQLKQVSSEILVKSGDGLNAIPDLAAEGSGHSRSRRVDRLHFLKTVRGIKKTGAISPSTIQPLRTITANSPTPSACSQQSNATEISVKSDDFQRRLKAWQSLAPACRQPNNTDTRNIHPQPKKTKQYNAVSQRQQQNSQKTPKTQPTNTRTGALWRYWEHPVKPSSQ